MKGGKDSQIRRTISKTEFPKSNLSFVIQIQSTGPIQK